MEQKDKRQWWCMCELALRLPKRQTLLRAGALSGGHRRRLEV
jgi:hypothetical protein